MGSDVLKNYTDEEIREFATKYLIRGEPELGANDEYKITQINKQYRNHNTKAIGKAVLNTSLILGLTAIVMNSDSNMANFGTSDILSVMNSLELGAMNLASSFPSLISDIVTPIYSHTFDGINRAIAPMGVIGIVLATKSVKLVTNSLKDSKKANDMKKEMTLLKEQLSNTTQIKAGEGNVR